MTFLRFCVIIYLENVKGVLKVEQQKILKHFADKFNEMIDTNEFWAIYFQDPFSIINSQQIPYPICCGISRGSYIDKDFPYVVKWQLTGDSLECEREEEIYNHACYDNVEQYFAESIYLGEYVRCVNTFSAADYHDMSSDEFYPAAEEFAAIMTSMEQFGYERELQHIYLRLWAYPRAEVITRWIKPHSEEVYSSAKQSQASDDPLSMDYNIACCWIDELGLAEYERLNAFLMENDVNDLHGGNIMRRNGQLIIIDYAGVTV